MNARAPKFGRGGRRHRKQRQMRVNRIRASWVTDMFGMKWPKDVYFGDRALTPAEAKAL